MSEDIRDIYRQSANHHFDIEVSKHILESVGLDMDPEEYLESLKKFLKEREKLREEEAMR